MEDSANSTEGCWSLSWLVQVIPGENTRTVFYHEECRSLDKEVELPSICKTSGTRLYTSTILQSPIKTGDHGGREVSHTPYAMMKKREKERDAERERESARMIQPSFVTRVTPPTPPCHSQCAILCGGLTTVDPPG